MKTISSLFQLMPNLRLLLVKLGKMGSLVVSNNKYHCQKALTQPKNGVSADLSVGFYEAPNVPDEELVNVSGSGDW
jgi:sugar/nucleoside kinase (ribokinase family)